jgi:hypothetical protein
VFSFSSDERSTSDDADDASFAWRSSSVPDMDVGRRRGALAIVAGGDFVAERPKAEEMDGTRVCDTLLLVGEVVVAEREARWRAAGGGPIEPSIVRVGLMVVGVGSLLVVVVVLVGVVVAVEFMRTLLPSVVTPEALPAFGASLLSSERRDAGRDEWPGGENVVDSRRMWPTLLGAGVGPAVPLTLMRRFNYVFFRQ